MDPWDAAAPGYDGAMRLAGWRQAQRAFVAGLSGTVLDMGCGTGFVATLLGHRCVGLDRNPAMLARARGPVVVADAAAAPFADAAFDTVISTAFLGLLDPDRRGRVLPEMARVTRGEIRVLEPVAGHTRWPWLALSRRPLEPAEFAAAGLEVLSVGPARYLGVYAAVTARRSHLT